LKLFDANEEIMEAPSMGGTLTGDIMKPTDLGVDSRSVFKNSAVVDYNFVSGGSNQAQKTFAMPLLKTGQHIGVELVNLAGSLTPDVSIRVRGMVKYQDKSNDGNWLDGSNIINLDEEYEGSISI